MKMLYEATYMLRGHSGIPKDTAEQAKILHHYFPTSLNLGIDLNSFMLIRRFVRQNRVGDQNILSKLFEVSPRKGNFVRFIENVLVILETCGNLLERTPILLHERLHGLVPEKLQQISQGDKAPLYIFPVNSKSRYLMGLLRMPVKINTENFDLFIQQSLLPIRVSKNTRHVIRLHDVLPITNPEFFTPSVTLLFRRMIFEALKDKDVVWVLPTRATEREFQQLFGYELRTHVVFNAILDQYFGDFEKKEKLILMLATIEPRKNIDLAIEGFSQAVTSGLISKDWKLIVAGSYGWSKEKLYLDLKANAFGSQVMYFESPTDSEVEDLRERSSLTLCVSNNEGFSRPPLEGMMFGCIPVVSDIAQHRETIGDLGQYIAGKDVGSISEAIGRGVKASETATFELRNRFRTHVLLKFSGSAIAEQWRVLFNEIGQISDAKSKEEPIL